MAGPTKLRTLHRWTAPFTGIYLMVFALTGMVYRILKDMFDYDNEHIHYFLEIHSAEIYDRTHTVKLIYIVIAMALITTQVLTGVTLIERWWGVLPRKVCKEGPPFYHDARTFHHFLASFLWAFLLMKVYSNGVFVIREDGAGAEVSLGDYALYHDARVPGADEIFPFIYAMVLGSLVLCLAIAGFIIKFKKPKKKVDEEYFLTKDYDWEAYTAYNYGAVEADPRRTKSDAWLQMTGNKQKQAQVPAPVPE